MKKLYPFYIALCMAVTIASCQREEASTDLLPDGDKTITVRTYVESVDNSATKLQMQEGESSFNLHWSGNEALYVYTSTNTSSSQKLTISEYSGKNASFTGVLPNAGEGVATTRYIGMVSSFSSSAAFGIRGSIPAVQYYGGNNLADNVILYAVSEEVAVGQLPAFSLKTMNGFMKFSFKKGSAAPGASNVYDKMYVQSITVEAIGGENIAGRFTLSRTASFTEGYAEETAGYVSPSVTLNCVTEDYPDGVEVVQDKAVPFYIAVKFGEYSQGLKVTVHVKNQDGYFGKVEKTVSSGKRYTIERNHLKGLAALALEPKDNTVIKYTLVNDYTALEDGKYLLAGKVSDKYYVFSGSVISGNLATTTEGFTVSEDVITVNNSGSVAEVTLAQSGAGFTIQSGSNYLSASAASNKSMKLTSSPAVWTFGPYSKGGFTMQEATYGTYLRTASSTISNVLRNYVSATTGAAGVFLFKKTLAGGEGGGGGESGATPGGWLEMPYVPASLGSKFLVTITATMNGISGARNYSLLYDPEYYAQMWTAYPLCSSHMGSLGRPNKWSVNPLIDETLQTKLSSGYGASVATEHYSNNYYARGHQIANADRNGIEEMQDQTFYWTNSTPQIQNGFNGDIWTTLEGAVRDFVSGADTVYVVTGPVYQTVGGTETVKSITNKNDSKSIPVPNYYYKAVLKAKWDSNGNVTDALAVGFWFEHKEYYKISDYSGYAVSVEYIEGKTGLDLYANLPDALKSKAKSNSSVTTFRNF